MAGFMAHLLSPIPAIGATLPTTGIPVVAKMRWLNAAKPVVSSVLRAAFSSRLCAMVLPMVAALVYGSFLSLKAGTELWGNAPLHVYTIEQMGGHLGKSWSAAQDVDGTIYFGRVGVSSFDGDRWSFWPVNGANAVRGLAFAAPGKLWAGGNGEVGWLERKGPTWSYHSLVSELPEQHRALPELWNAFAVGDGALFIENSKVLYWDGKTFRVWSLPDDRRLRAFRAGKKIYIQHMASGLYTFTPAGLELVIPASILGVGNKVWWARQDKESYRLLTGNGFATINQGKLIPDNTPTSDAIQRGFPSLAVELPENRVAVATVYSGVILTQPDGLHHESIDRASGLPAQSVNGLYIDRDYQLWIMGDSYVARVPLNPKSRIFDRRSGLPEEPIVSIAVDGSRVAAATESGVFELAHDDTPLALARSRGWLVFDLLYTPESLLSAGFRGVRQTIAGKTTSVLDTNTDVYTLVPSRARSGHYLVVENATIKRWDLNTEPETVVHLPEAIYSLMEERDGSLWMGSFRSGVFHAEARNSKRLVKSPHPNAGLPQFQAPAIVTGDRDGAIYVLSEQGAWRKEDGAKMFLPVSDFPHRGVLAVTQPLSSDEIWLALHGEPGRPAGIGRILVQNGTARWQPEEIESLTAISTPRALATQKLSNGATEVWIGGSNGILRTEIATGQTFPPPRPPLLSASVTSADNVASQEISAPIPYTHRSLRFALASPEFGRREMLRFEIFIEGIDHDWMPVGKDASRELTAVRDGHYRLLARTVSDTGMVSDNAELRFRVLPPWWRTTPMLVAFALGMIPLGYGFFYLRTRALRRRNAALEARVQERTKELEAANAELAAASAAKTEFVANMSHDIRNPLNGIVGLALALEDSRLDGRQREMVATLRECTGYLSTLVDDVLDFASIEAGRIELRPGPLAPGELLRSIVTTLKSETAERGATLLYEVDPELPPHLLGDAGRVQQILVNFVSNALKYAGGTIQLSATRPADAPGEVEFAVRDWGPGMNEDDRSTLFKKFSRLTRARQEGITGTGLGLASCRLLADIMGGSVGVESEPGKGSRFFLRLPLTVVVEKPEPAPHTLPQAAVLLVEDTDYNAWAAKAVLARLGLACDRARDGAEAVRMFEEKRYNVVLLDRNLPDMDGLEVAKRIRASETDGLQAVILAVTAYATAEDRQLCLDAGMDAFVGKPLTPDKLRRALLGAGRKQLATATVDLSRPATNPPMSTPSASAASSQPEPAPAKLDLALLTYLSDGTSAGFGAQVERFLETLSTTQSELATALASRDFEQAKVFAHRINGQAKMVGYAPLAQATLKLEESAFQHDPARCAHDMEHVNQEIEALRAAMASPSRSLSPA